MLQSQSEETGENVTKTQKIKWGAILTGIVAVMTIYSFLPSAVQVATKADTEAVVARFEPVECDTLENSIRIHESDRQRYIDRLEETPDDSFVEEQVRFFERKIKEKQAKRESLGCI